MLVVLEGILWTIRFFFGACIFSFLTVVIDRLPRGENVVRGRSHCTGCGRELTAWELIPCVSFLCQGGKCRGCGGEDPFKVFLDRTYRWSSFYRLRDQIWLRQIRRNIVKRRSDFCIFRNITCGSPD